MPLSVIGVKAGDSGYCGNIYIWEPARKLISASPRPPKPVKGTLQTPNVEALIIGIGFWGPLYYNCNKEPLKSYGSLLKPL